jgi:hypothetical protein
MGTKPDGGNTSNKDREARKSRDNMVLLIQLVKGMREMGYEPHFRETISFDS